MLKYFLVPALFLLYACDSDPKLTEGRWTGSLSPMNHPEMQNPVAYDVGYRDTQLQIDLIGPDGTSSSTKNVKMTSDTLYFAFSEPEEKVLLKCALAKENQGLFRGRCTDLNGKWAMFTMIAPDQKAPAN